MTEETNPNLPGTQGSPVPDTAPATSPDTATTSDAGTPTPKTFTQADFDRFVKKQDAEFVRDFGADKKTLREFQKALRENPRAVAEALMAQSGQTVQKAPAVDPRYQQLEQTVYNLSLSSQIKELTEEFPRVKNQEHLAEVLEFAQENQVDLRTAYLHKFYKKDVEDKEKEVTERIRRKQGAFLEGAGAADEPEADELTPDEVKTARKMGLTLKEYKKYRR